MYRKNVWKATVDIKFHKKLLHCLALQKRFWYFNTSFFVLNIFFHNCLQISYFNGFGARWCKSSLTHEKHKMLSKSYEKKLNFEIPFQLTELSFISNQVWSATLWSLSSDDAILRTSYTGARTLLIYQSKSNILFAKLPNLDDL